jgi:hypothetical protein
MVKKLDDDEVSIVSDFNENDFADSDDSLDYDTIVELECGDRAYACYPLQEMEYCFVCQRYRKVIPESE